MTRALLLGTKHIMSFTIRFGLQPSLMYKTNYVEIPPLHEGKNKNNLKKYININDLKQQ